MLSVRHSWIFTRQVPCDSTPFWESDMALIYKIFCIWLKLRLSTNFARVTTNLFLLTERLVHTPSQGNATLPAKRRLFFFSFIYCSRQQNGLKAVGETKFDYGKDTGEIVQSVIAIWNTWSFRVWYLPRDYSWISMVCNGCVRAHRRYAVSSLLTITLGGAHAPLAGTRSAALLIGGLLFIVLIEDGRLFASFCETSLKFSEARGYKNILLAHAGAGSGVFAIDRVKSRQVRGVRSGQRLHPTAGQLGQVPWSGRRVPAALHQLVLLN